MAIIKLKLVVGSKRFVILVATHFALSHFQLFSVARLPKTNKQVYL